MGGDTSLKPGFGTSRNMWHLNTYNCVRICEIDREITMATQTTPFNDACEEMLRPVHLCRVHRFSVFGLVSLGGSIGVYTVISKILRYPIQPTDTRFNKLNPKVQ